MLTERLKDFDLYWRVQITQTRMSITIKSYMFVRSVFVDQLKKMFLSKKKVKDQRVLNGHTDFLQLKRFLNLT